MKRTALALAAACLTLAACGSGSNYESVPDLVDALEEKGIDCPEFTQVDPSGNSAGHGSCAENGETFLGLDVYESEEDRDAEIASTVDAFEEFDMDYCLVYADLWSVNASSSDDCETIANEMGGEVKRS